MKAISPIIAIIIILLITIAIAGAGYSYLSTYWTSLVGREIEVINAFCSGGNQGKIMVRNIGTNPLSTGDITVIDPLTGEDLSQDVLWASEISDPNLVLELKFDEGSGITAKDTSGKGNDGTLEGDTFWVDGKVGKALSFDGDGDYVDCGNDASVDIIGDKITLEAWIKTTTSTADERIIIGKHQSGNSVGYFLEKWTDDAAGFWTSAGASRTIGTTSIVDGKWHHIVGVYDGSNRYIYVDGVLENSNAQTGNLVTTASSLKIGALSSSPTNSHFNGIIDEVRIYSRALSEDEIKALAENSVPLQPGETATLTHTCSGRCRYSLVLGGMAREAMLEC